jgi:hypothetical protein
LILEDGWQDIKIIETLLTIIVMSINDPIDHQNGIFMVYRVWRYLMDC